MFLVNRVEILRVTMTSVLNQLISRDPRCRCSIGESDLSLSPLTLAVQKRSFLMIIMLLENLITILRICQFKKGAILTLKS